MMSDIWPLTFNCSFGGSADAAMNAFDNCTYDYRQGDVICGNQFDDAIGRSPTGDDSWRSPGYGDETWERQRDLLQQQLRYGEVRDVANEKNLSASLDASRLDDAFNCEHVVT
jgi:hypothetical protein